MAKKRFQKRPGFAPPVRDVEAGPSETETPPPIAVLAIPEEPVIEETPEPQIWACPGCAARWEGPEGSGNWIAYRSHLKRHAHAATGVPTSRAGPTVLG